MSVRADTVEAVAPVVPARYEVRRPGVAATIRVELTKLSSQLALRVVIGVCVVVPVGFAVMMRIQSSRPSDTLFGRWSGTSGLATALTVLSFAGQWGVPLLAGLFAGDIFASEDRHGTWKTLLTRSCSRTRLFIGKALAAVIAVWLAFAILALVSVLAGLTIVGSAPLVGLSGQSIAPQHALWLVWASWAFTLLPATAIIALALLLSVASRASIVGVVGPLVVGIVLQLLSAVASGQTGRAILLSTPVDAWHGLFTTPVHARPLLQGAVTSVAYTVIFAAAGWWLLRRRAFAGSDAVTHDRRRASVQIAIAIAVAAIALAALGGRGPTALTAGRLQASIAPTFARLNQLRYQLDTGFAAPAVAPARAVCNRGAGTQKSQGPGDDWSCTITDLRAADHAPPVVLDVTLRANGCYTAQAPPTVVGALQIDGTHGVFTNPLYAFDGCFGTP